MPHKFVRGKNALKGVRQRVRIQKGRRCRKWSSALSYTLQSERIPALRIVEQGGQRM